MESVNLDDLDRRLIHALQIDGRAPFRRIADVLGVSERTIARRYQRLRSRLVLRVVGRVDSARAGLVDTVVLIRCAPGADEQLAAALSRRPDTSWVALMAGGQELTGIFATPVGTDLTGALSRLPDIRAFSAHTVLRYVAGTEGWSGRTNALTRAEQVALAPPDSEVEPEVAQAEWTDRDVVLADELALDGRADLHRLAARTGWSEPTVRRRLAGWRAAGVLAFEVEIDPALFGHAEEALVWLAVAPAGLREVLDTLRAHPGVAFAATVTGSWSVFVILELPSATRLHDFLTVDLAALPAITRVETALIRRRTKRAGPLLVAATARAGRGR
ncbi:Lrp/AsnC family transcriptional regulator [Nocardia sp. AG03]|uniref:Lrp/AsnC family transcriptional regulator n=1 Tax=Nocardia sp. AG03 TaxID=3025312 RepID=UPI0024181565|nr:Lrp/AsnC family transcriptional regulator [Nocardia sp. AG03]